MSETSSHRQEMPGSGKLPVAEPNEMTLLQERYDSPSEIPYLLYKLQREFEIAYRHHRFLLENYRGIHISDHQMHQVFCKSYAQRERLRDLLDRLQDIQHRRFRPSQRSVKKWLTAAELESAPLITNRNVIEALQKEQAAWQRELDQLQQQVPSAQEPNDPLSVPLNTVQRGLDNITHDYDYFKEFLQQDHMEALLGDQSDPN